MIDLKSKELQDKFLSQWAKKLDISKGKLSDIIKILESKRCAWMLMEKEWQYPQSGDNQKSCLMLDAMFHIERRKGVILFLPYREEEKV